MKPEEIDAVAEELYNSYLKGLETDEGFLSRLNEIASPFVDVDGKINNKDLFKVICAFAISESIRTSVKINAEVLKRLLA